MYQSENEKAQSTQQLVKKQVQSKQIKQNTPRLTLNIKSRRKIPPQLLEQKVIQMQQHSEKSTSNGSYSYQCSPYQEQKTQEKQLKSEQMLDSFYQKYQIKQKLGQGVSGVVFRCVKKDNEGSYAVKCTRCQPQQVSTMKHSYNTIQMLNHKNIIKYKSIYISSTQYKCYLVMQYYPYPNLATFTFQSLAEIQQIMYQIFDAIDYMHSMGLCHRDIKAQNILYNRELQQIKIIDFGVARYFGVGKLKRQMMTFTGTTLYKAPEMVNGGFYTEKIDQWAAGVTLYKLITGKTPFESPYLKQTLQNIESCRVQFQQQVWKNYSSLTQSLILQLLSFQEKRITAKQAKNSLWFNFGHKQLHQSISPSIVELHHKNNTQFHSFQEYLSKSFNFKQAKKTTKNGRNAEIRNFKILLNITGGAEQFSDYQISDSDIDIDCQSEQQQKKQKQKQKKSQLKRKAKIQVK